VVFKVLHQDIVPIDEPVVFAVGVFDLYSAVIVGNLLVTIDHNLLHPLTFRVPFGLVLKANIFLIAEVT